jgi:hypothetical protein
METHVNTLHYPAEEGACLGITAAAPHSILAGLVAAATCVDVAHHPSGTALLPMVQPARHCTCEVGSRLDAVEGVQWAATVIHPISRTVQALAPLAALQPPPFLWRT